MFKKLALLGFTTVRPVNTFSTTNLDVQKLQAKQNVYTIKLGSIFLRSDKSSILFKGFFAVQCTPEIRSHLYQIRISVLKDRIPDLDEPTQISILNVEDNFCCCRNCISVSNIKQQKIRLTCVCLWTKDPNPYLFFFRARIRIQVTQKGRICGTGVHNAQNSVFQNDLNIL